MIQLQALQSGIVDHCNNRCNRCSQLAPIRRAQIMGPDELWADLETLTKIAHAPIFHFVGGEPLLHPNIVGMIKIAKQSGIADRVSIYTNGKLILSMPPEFWTSGLDQLHISIYPNTNMGTVGYAEMKCKLNGIEFEAWPQPGFYSVRKMGGLTYNQACQNFKGCPWRWGCNAVRYGYFFLCSHSALLSSTLMGLEEESQGIKIEGLTEECLSDFLHRERPLTACSICWNHYEQYPWSESRDMNDWLKNSFSSK